MSGWDWQPGPRVALWGKRAALGIICGGWWAIEALLLAVVLGSLTHAIRPGLQDAQDWGAALLFVALWTPFAIVVTLAVRAEWPRRAAASMEGTDTLK